MKSESSNYPDASQDKRRTAVLAFMYRQRWFGIFVVVPVFLATIYFGFVASDIYVSEARFVIKAPNQKQGQLSTLANLIQTTGLSGGQEQTGEVLQYVRSRNALQDLSKRIDVRAKFGSPEADLLSRFPAPFRLDRFENLYKFYGKMVDARLDPDTGTAILTVKAFTPQDAHELNVRTLELSEALVNRLNDRAQNKAITEAEKRLRDAEMRVSSARVALRQYRNTAELLDPAKQASGVLEISNRLIGEQAVLKAQLEAMVRAAPANPSIPALRSRIAAISNQIATQTVRVVGSDTGIASKLSGYEKLTVEQEFATQMLNVTGAALEQARSDAQKQQFYLERVVQPNIPDMALLPNRLKQILAVAAAAICLYFIGWMLIVGILEHAPED